MSNEILKALQQVQQWPKDVHWFCPREVSEDDGFYYDEDIVGQLEADTASAKEARDKKIAKAEKRTQSVFDALQIFAFDGSDAAEYQTWLEENLAEQMQRCDICIRQYHRGRRKFKETLTDTYDKEAVDAFMEKFDGLNVRRIEYGLDEAVKQLKNVPESSRRAAVLDPVALYALFETLTCRAMYSNEQRLKQHFDEPFQLVQTKRFLKMSSYAPAMTQFLFGSDKDRQFWAEKSWSIFKRNITATEFEWSVREPLTHAMFRVQMHQLDKGFLEQFWNGVRVIVLRLDRDLITHSLRAIQQAQLDTDICTLAFNHLQVDSDGLKPLLASIQKILTENPNDFWDSMGARPANAWIEQVFNSPALARFLESARDERISDSPVFEELFGWINPYLTSIKAVNQPPVTRALADRLLGYMQDTKYAQVVRTFCFKLGLTVLSETFKNLNIARLPTSATAGEVFEATEKNISRIVPLAKKKSSLIEPATEVFRQALAFDCETVKTHMNALSQSKKPQDSSPAFHSSIWKMAATSLDIGNVVLAKKLFLAFRTIAGIEPFVTKKDQTLPPPREQFNTALVPINHAIQEILERINDFDPLDLEQLFSDADSANATIMLLFHSDAQVRTSAAEMIKTMSGQTTRKEAVDFAVRKFFVSTISAFSYSFRQIAHQKAFAPAQSTLKLCSDLLDALCNSEDGVLRSQTISREETRAVENFWQTMWTLLIMMFEMTEEWSYMGHDKDVLMNFCRDVMEFAEKAFDQFGVIKGALEQTAESDAISHAVSKPQESAGKRLVEQPRKAMKVMVKWLKLRDEFLVARSNALVCKLLVRLKDYETALDEQPLQLILQIVFGESRTTLTAQQRAELRRALETHIGHSLDIESEIKAETTPANKTAKRPGLDMEKWKLNAKTAKVPDATLESTISASSTAYEKFRAMQAAKGQSKQALASRLGSTPSVAPAAKTLDTSEFIRRRKQAEEEMKKKNAAAIAAQRKRALGEGSGVVSLGVHGKEHDIPKGTGMMVSSDEEESDEESESELDKELFGPATKATNRTNLTDEQARAMKQRQRGPVKKTRMVRSAKDMRARLAPDLASLHKVLLGWEYFHEGSFPPGSAARDYAGVVNTFRDASEYQRTFQPLLTLETWSGFAKAKEENTASPFELKILNRSNVDQFIELSTSMSQPKQGRDAKLPVSEGDLVLLSKSQTPGSSPGVPHCMAKVMKVSRKKGNIEVMYRVIHGNPLVPTMAPGVLVWGLQVMSVTPLEREYGALIGLQYYDLCDEITRAKPSPLLNYTDEKLQPLERIYNVNRAQAKAVKSALDNDAFTLIQGPPGSGKTKTIVAIVGALLSDSLRNKGVVIRPAQNGAAGGLAKKMLICAPSNAAVDELVMRFKEGVKTMSGEQQKVNIVRLGRSDAINANVQDVTLEELINKRLNLNSKGDSLNSTRADTQKIMNEHKEVSEELRQVRVKMDEADENGGPTKQLKEEFDNLRRKKTLLGEKIDSAKDGEQTQSRQADLQRRKAMQEVVNEAHVICATLSGSGHEMFQTLDVEFETVIIDEAAQCVELSALIPLKYGCAKCILVGDPQQLPPTVFSKDAARFKYEQSLFVRMQSNHPKDVHLLDTQYRMHPEISVFPSKTFYEGRLLDGKDMAAIRARPWHGTELLSPYRFFDVQGQHQSAPTGHSLVNYAEVRIALQLYGRLTTDFRNYDFKGKIGIITPYKSQLRELKEQFRRQLGEDISSGIEFNTTDAFQGREAEIIIFSCVRASPAGGIGFLQDIRRMNVGLTRAKCSLWVLGNSQSLMKGEYWAKLVDESKAKNRYTTGDLESMLRSPSKLVQRIGDGSAQQNGRKTSTSGDIKMERTEDDGAVKTEPASRHVQSEPKPNAIKQESKPIKADAHIKTGSGTSHSMIKPLSTTNGHARIKQDSSPAVASPSPAPPVLLKRKLSTTSDIRNSKEIKTSRSPSIASHRDSDTEMKDAYPSAPPSRPISSASSVSAKTNASASSTAQIVGQPGPATGNTAGGAAMTKPPPPGMPKKKADPFIRKKR